MDGVETIREKEFMTMVTTSFSGRRNQEMLSLRKFCAFWFCQVPDGSPSVHPV